MRKQITFLLLLFIGFCATAQTVNIKGVVKDAATGDPLPGVSVILKGTSKGTNTDFDGNYSLTNIDKGAILVFRYLGYAEKEVTVTSSNLNVSLTVESESLDEIVVVGYGAQRKRKLQVQLL